LVAFAQAEQILREVGRIDISQSSIWRRVDRWGRRLQAIEALQQAKAYGFEDPESLDPNCSRGRMGAAMDGTMVHIREEGWKELKVGCVFDIALRRQFDPHTQEEVELGSAIKCLTYLILFVRIDFSGYNPPPVLVFQSGRSLISVRKENQHEQRSSFSWHT
jgi:hypothetical protein